MTDENSDMITAALAPAEKNGGMGDPVIVYAEQTPGALRIRDALIAEQRLAGATLRIQVHDNQAVVSGFVRTEEQHNLALNITGRYVGRDRVIDELETGEQISYEVCEV